MEMEHLEFRLDSLGALVQQLRDPFGPTIGTPAGDTFTAPVNDPIQP